MTVPDDRSTPAASLAPEAIAVSPIYPVNPKPTVETRLHYRIFRRFLQIVYVIYFRGRVFNTRNVPQEGGVLLACNHQSFFDPICCSLALHRAGNYMARDTLFLNPYFKRLISSLNAFPVKRGAADIGAVKEILRRLKAGRLVLVFPEGTRTRDGAISHINPNSLLIAKKARCAIVPAVIDGAYEAWPRTQLLPSPSTIHVTYCKALLADEVRERPIEEIAAIVEERMKTTLEKSRAIRRRVAGR